MELVNKNKMFDPAFDYFDELLESEKYSDDKGREYPYLKGLIRLAHKYRGGVKEVHSRIHKAPSVNSFNFVEAAKQDASSVVNKNISIPDCIAAVTISYHFNDGTIFEGSADASYKAHGAPYNLHLTAVAESKAEARALRRAFAITQVSKEEIGQVDVAGDPDNGPITDAQINGLRIVAKRKGISQSQVFKMAGRADAKDIKELTSEEGRKALKKVNAFKQKKDK